MAATRNTNTEFELRGFNHLALVCRDMAETVAWYEDVLGMKLVKTLELPGGRGQHFFLDMGNGVDGIAFFWFPDAPEGVRGESIQGRNGMSAIGSMNHIAFDVPPEKMDEYRDEAARARASRSRTIINHANSLDGGHKPDYDAGHRRRRRVHPLDVLPRSERHDARVRVLDAHASTRPTCSTRRRRPPGCPYGAPDELGTHLACFGT